MNDQSIHELPVRPQEDLARSQEAREEAEERLEEATRQLHHAQHQLSAAEAAGVVRERTHLQEETSQLRRELAEARGEAADAAAAAAAELRVAKKKHDLVLQAGIKDTVCTSLNCSSTQKEVLHGKKGPEVARQEADGVLYATFYVAQDLCLTCFSGTILLRFRSGSGRAVKL